MGLPSAMALKEAARKAAWRLLGAPPRERVRAVGRHLESPGVRLIGDVVIGDHTTVGVDSLLHGPVTVGRYSQIGPSNALYGQNHSTDHLSTYVNERLFDGRLRSNSVLDRSIIGNDVWTGHGAIVLPGVVVGNSSVLAAGAVVTNDVRPFTIVAGCPARMIGERFDPELRSAIDEWAWWDAEPGELSEFEELFRLRLTDPVERARFLARVPRR